MNQEWWSYNETLHQHLDNLRWLRDWASARIIGTLDTHITDITNFLEWYTTNPLQESTLEISNNGQWKILLEKWNIDTPSFISIDSFYEAINCFKGYNNIDKVSSLLVLLWFPGEVLRNWHIHNTWNTGLLRITDWDGDGNAQFIFRDQNSIRDIELENIPSDLFKEYHKNSLDSDQHFVLTYQSTWLLNSTISITSLN